MVEKTDRNEKGQFTIGHFGTEKQFTDPEELQTHIDQYFDHQDSNPIIKSEVHGKNAETIQVPIQRPYTIEGLARQLGLVRMSLINYEKREGYEPYFDIIKRAKEKIREQWIELGLIGVGKEHFTKFMLINNADYQDKSEVDHRSGDRSMQPMNIIVDSKETGDEFKKLIDGAKDNQRPAEE